MAENWTPGPLRVEGAEGWPYRILTMDAKGKIVFSDSLPCHSSADRSFDGALNAVNFNRGDEQDKAAAMNARALADAHIRAAAPEMYDALKAIQQFCDDPQGGEKPETLARGLARLLPAARAALRKARGED